MEGVTVDATPRYLWQLLEPLHAVLYFAPETKQEAAALGLDGKGMAYVGFRAAPLGRVNAATVTAVFHGFHPRLISGAVPAVWERAHPEDVLSARLSVVGRVLARLLPDATRRTLRLAGLLDEVVANADVSGRPLAAANRDLPTPSEPALAVWHAATVLREHRGDGHVAALVCAQLGPCAAHVVRAATGAWAAETLRATRGWSEHEWAEAAEQLRDRGWLSSTGELTATGWREHRAYEQLTDELAAAPWRRLSAERLAEVAGLLEPLAAAVVDAGGVPVGGALGSPWPPTPGVEAAALSAP